jgi:Na+/melibiose symporter-like transporter
MKSSNQKVSMAEKIGYSLGDGSANLVFQMMMMFQLFFYTDVFGIKATAAGMILLVARVFDAFVDPVVGILSDRTQIQTLGVVDSYSVCIVFYIGFFYTRFD